jgi:hypothetical protein
MRTGLLVEPRDDEQPVPSGADGDRIEGRAGNGFGDIAQSALADPGGDELLGQAHEIGPVLPGRIQQCERLLEVRSWLGLSQNVRRARVFVDAE